MDYNELKAFLMGEAAFTEKQWQELGALCEIRQGNFTGKMTGSTHGKVEVGDEHARLFYERLKVFLLDHNFCGVAPIHVLRKSQPSHWRNTKKVAAGLYQIASKWNSEGRNHRNFCIGVYHLYVQLTVEYLRKCKVPVSVKTVLQHLDKFEGLVDEAYPSYIENGLMPLVIFGEVPDTIIT